MVCRWCWSPIEAVAALFTDIGGTVGKFKSLPLRACRDPDPPKGAKDRGSCCCGSGWQASQGTLLNYVGKQRLCAWQTAS